MREAAVEIWAICRAWLGLGLVLVLVLGLGLGLGLVGHLPSLRDVFLLALPPLAFVLLALSQAPQQEA